MFTGGGGEWREGGWSQEGQDGRNMPCSASPLLTAPCPCPRRRAARLSLYGLLLDGPVGHAWYKLLDRHVYPEVGAGPAGHASIGHEA